MCINCDLRAFKWPYCFVDFVGGFLMFNLLRAAEKIFTDTLCHILILFDMKFGFIYSSGTQNYYIAPFRPFLGKNSCCEPALDWGFPF